MRTHFYPLFNELYVLGLSFTRTNGDPTGIYLQGLGFTHRTVNHSVNFVNPINGVHTQNIESYWNKHKSQIKKMHGCRREFLPSYIQEFMWRDRFGVNGFANLCQHIALQYPQQMSLVNICFIFLLILERRFFN